MEHIVTEGLHHTFQHLAGMQGPAVIHGAEDAHDLQIGVEAVGDLGDGVSQQRDAAKREKLAFERHDHVVAGGESVDGQQPKTGGAVNEDEVVFAAKKHTRHSNEEGSSCYKV